MQGYSRFVHVHPLCPQLLLQRLQCRFLIQNRLLLWALDHLLCQIRNIQSNIGLLLLQYWFNLHSKSHVRFPLKSSLVRVLSAILQNQVYLLLVNVLFDFVHQVRFTLKLKLLSFCKRKLLLKLFIHMVKLTFKRVIVLLYKLLSLAYVWFVYITYQLLFT